MKTRNGGNGCSWNTSATLSCALAVAVFLFFAVKGQGQSIPDFGSAPTNTPLDSWSFYDYTNWTSDLGYAPVSFTNLIRSPLGDGYSLVVDTNVTAWLQYNVYESDGTTNLTVDAGSVTFWFAPNWASTNQGGTGPGDWGRLFEVGGYTPDSSYGLWSIYVDPEGANIYFSTQTNDLSSNVWTWLSVPIAWTNDYFHFVALTYCATNTALYLDGVLATNGLPMTVYPGLNALTNGFWIGSSSNGVNQSHGLFDLVATYNYPLNSNDVQAIYGWYYWDLAINPYNFDYLDTNSYQSSSSYGTNLAIGSVSISNNLASLFLINSIGDVYYEIQGTTNLAHPNWTSLGFVYGLELTNLTLASVMVTNKPALFLRIRSWQDNGSGLPIWWQLQYFGTNNVNPYGDPAGDGWNNLEKFQLGMNPTNFYTPPAPVGLKAVFNSANSTAKVSWLPSPSPLTGYTVKKYDQWSQQTANSNFAASVSGFSDTITDGSGEKIITFPVDLDYGPTIPIQYQIQAHYPNGDSAWSTPVLLEPNYSSANGIIATLPVYLAGGPQGTANLAAYGLPANTMALRVKRADEYANINYGDASFDTNVDIPVSALNNGLYSLPTTLTAPPADSYGQTQYAWYVQTVDTNGNPSEPMLLSNGNIQNSTFATFSWIVPPYFDGRAQLKQNLTFLLRAATVDAPFDYVEIITNTDNSSTFTNPPNYAYAGFYQFDGTDTSYERYPGAFDFYWPFKNNYRYRNFVFNASELDVSGRTLTGAGGNYAGNEVASLFYPGGLLLESPPAYQFQPPTTNGVPISALLATNNSRWLVSYALDSSSTYLKEIGVTNNAGTYSMYSNARNIYGLPFLSANIAYSGPGYTTLNAGNNTTQGGYFYPETSQPQFQAVEYDFWNSSALPGSTNFSTTNKSDLLITSVGNSKFQVTCYAKLAVLNGYTNVFAYLGQYFDQAYQINTNGAVTTNTTGLLSPYGNFFATQPGPSALVTMPDTDTGQRGTCTVYAISLAMDANHDGMMNTNFGVADNTSQANPYIFWCNNNFDRLAYDADDSTNYEDDVHPGNPHAVSPFTGTPTPDYEYRDSFGHRVIPTKRDLEDFARLWACGVTSNLLALLPINSTITLNWGDVGNPNPNNPTIDLFVAGDADGGIGYLTNSTIATIQTNPLQSPYVNRLGPGGSVQLNTNQLGQSGNWLGNHFVWCGVSNGTGQLNLTIADGNGTVLAQASQWVKIVDIKQMYERWTVGDNPNLAPTNIPQLAATDLPTNAMQQPYQYPPNTVANTSYILFVHGWNLEPWEKDRFAETAFKRLYWQGYQGRFGEFRWPTDYGFNGIPTLLTNIDEADNFDNSEYQAWQSASGLLNLLTNLDMEYSGQVYVLAHSMGNIVAGEAVRRAGTNRVANTYVATQAAVTAHTYDTNVPNYSFYIGIISFGPVTPNIYGNWFAGNNGGGADNVISFYNTNDFALSRYHWQYDQLVKPDHNVFENGDRWSYGYTGSPNDSSPWNNFYKEDTNSTIYSFNIVTSLNNRYEVMAYAAQSYTTALGATPAITNLTSLSLTTIWPSPDPLNNNYASHFYHSAEFRGDTIWEWKYWNTLLLSPQLGFNIHYP